MGTELYPGNSDYTKDTDAYQRYEEENRVEPLDPSAPTGLTGIDQDVKDELLRRQQNDQNG